MTPLLRAGRRAPERPAGELPRVCIVGAGASGIAAAKALADRGIPFDCFDKGNAVGGTWVMDNASGLASAYRDLYINVSRERMEYSDFPMPKSCPAFPHRTHIVKYFNDYVDHFGLRDRIRLGTTVESARCVPPGMWEIALDDDERHTYDALIVANGHHARPRWPSPPFPGEFEGLELHSHSYRDSELLRDRDVVVVGMGNSAMDIAVESAYVARSTQLSMRRGAHILPKYMLGRPFDQVPGLTWLLGRGVRVGRVGVELPWTLRRAILGITQRLVVGRMRDYGLPEPDHRIGESHPSVSTRILDLLVHGRIQPRPNIARFEGDRVHFVDGTSARADLIVYCTGYEIAFPFLPADLVPVRDNRVDLYRAVFRPGVPNLFFIGLIQPLGSVMQVAECQSTWAAEYLCGEYSLPGEDEMRRRIAADRRRMEARYVRSSRHTIQVDQHEYLWRLDAERHAGRRRAARADWELPVPRRAPAPGRDAERERAPIEAVVG